MMLRSCVGRARTSAIGITGTPSTKSPAIRCGSLALVWARPRHALRGCRVLMPLQMRCAAPLHHARLVQNGTPAMVVCSGDLLLTQAAPSESSSHGGIRESCERASNVRNLLRCSAKTSGEATHPDSLCVLADLCAVGFQGSACMSCCLALPCAAGYVRLWTAADHAGSCAHGSWSSASVLVYSRIGSLDLVSPQGRPL